MNCKKEGGTIFSNKDGILKAVCGRKDDKCNLDIEINNVDKLPTIRSCKIYIQLVREQVY